MANQSFSSFKKGALALAGLAVAAGFYMSTPQVDTAPEPQQTAEHRGNARHADREYMTGLYDSMEGAKGEVVLNGEDGVGLLGSMSQTMVSDDLATSDLYSDMNIGQASVQYTVHSADLNVADAFVVGRTSEIMEGGASGVAQAIEKGVGQVIDDGFLGENLNVMHTDPQAFADSFRQALQEKVNIITNGFDPSLRTKNVIHLEKVDLAKVCELTMDAGASQQMGAGLTTNGLAGQSCVDAVSVAPEVERPSLSELRKTRQAAMAHVDEVLSMRGDRPAPAVTGRMSPMG